MDLEYFDTELGRCIIEVRDYKGFVEGISTEVDYVDYVVYTEDDGQLFMRELLHPMNLDEMDKFVYDKVVTWIQEDAEGPEYDNCQDF